MIDPVRKHPFTQRLLRYVRPWTGLRPDWSWLGHDAGWKEAVRAAAGGPAIVIATSTGSNWPCSAFESALGIALTLRGARVRFLLCDGALPACQECDRQWLSEASFSRNGAKPLCPTCFAPALDMLEPLGLPVLRYGQYAGDGPAAETEAISRNLDEHARAGALRYFARGALPDTASATAIHERYRSAANLTARVISRLVREDRPDIAVFHHGIYVPQGVVGAVLRDAGVRVVNWGPAYRKSTVLFSQGDTYHRTMIDEQPSQWDGLDWPEERERLLLDYLRSRWTGGNDWISFQADAGTDRQAIADQLGLDPSRPAIGLLTNVIWDAQLHFAQSAFASMLDWLFASIDHFIHRPELQLVIRVHPAEVLGSVPSRQFASDEIIARYGRLPPNIKLVGPEARISTYALMSLCDSALVFGTKTALELACTGMNVVVAGDAWCRGKGFTVDVSSPEDYRRALGKLPFRTPLDRDRIEAARRYAYHFFFRRMIPLRFLDPDTPFGPFEVRVKSLAALRPGADPGLDTICDGILHGGPFVFDSSAT